jgi:hypothetical protein
VSIARNLPAGPAGPTPADAAVEVRRSARRRRTVSAYRDGDRTIVMIPARMSRADERRWVGLMLERLAAQERRRAGRAARGDAELAARASELSRRHLDGLATPSSVRWVANQGMRWGSCTPADGTIRLSDRLQGMPSWVIDYVLVHELAHLLEPGHGPAFEALVTRYPRCERARGYLIGVTAAGASDVPGCEFESAPGSGAEPRLAPELISESREPARRPARPATRMRPAATPGSTPGLW